MVVATLIGYFPNLFGIIGTGAFLVGLAFVAAAFGLGYLAGAGKDHLEDVGGLGTAQRNTAAGRGHAGDVWHAARISTNSRNKGANP